jgi:MFS transporter, ACS family, hexuronate transporter
MARMKAAMAAHRGFRTWAICGLLLLASTINYMDRQTLSNVAVRITSEFKLTQEQYGNLELVFGWAFAAGSLLFGFVADRISVRWLYPTVLLLWSLTGFSTGLVHSYSGFLVCRTMLGLFEAGHWPCALKTTQRLLAPPDRTMGNSVLQSGTSIGAVITPLIMSLMLTGQAGSWRFPFEVIGGLGTVWIFFWLLLVDEEDLSPRPTEVAATIPAVSGDSSFSQIIFSRRFFVLVTIVVCINTCWQLLRAWLPKFLQEGRGYAEADALHFNALFYVATDLGCLGAGALTLWLHRRGFTVHRSRSVVFLGCALLTALTTMVSLFPKGWLLLLLLLVVGVGALGLFPCYYALSQELSAAHQGKITGVTGVFAWAFSAPMHTLFGRLIDRTGSFDLGLALAGGLPLIAFVVLWCFWDLPRRDALVQLRESSD